jgi:hypothetical protein
MYEFCMHQCYTYDTRSWETEDNTSSYHQLRLIVGNDLWLHRRCYLQIPISNLFAKGMSTVASPLHNLILAYA